MRKKLLVQVLTAAIVGLLAATAAVAEDNTPAQPEATASTQSMQVAFFDPVTKQLRAPTPEEAAAFAKSLEQRRQAQGMRLNTSGRPRNEAESLKTLRTVHVNGYTMEVIDTPEDADSYMVGKRDAKGNLVAVHPGDEVPAAAVEVTK